MKEEIRLNEETKSFIVFLNVTPLVFVAHFFINEMFLLAKISLGFFLASFLITFVAVCYYPERWKNVKN